LALTTVLQQLAARLAGKSARKASLSHIALQHDKSREELKVFHVLPQRTVGASESNDKLVLQSQGEHQTDTVPCFGFAYEQEDGGKCKPDANLQTYYAGGDQKVRTLPYTSTAHYSSSLDTPGDTVTIQSGSIAPSPPLQLHLKGITTKRANMQGIDIIRQSDETNPFSNMKHVEGMLQHKPLPTFPRATTCLKHGRLVAIRGKIYEARCTWRILGDGSDTNQRTKRVVAIASKSREYGLKNVDHNVIKTNTGHKFKAWSQEDLIVKPCPTSTKKARRSNHGCGAGCGTVSKSSEQHSILGYDSEANKVSDLIPAIARNVWCAPSLFATLLVENSTARYKNLASSALYSTHHPQTGSGMVKQCLFEHSDLPIQTPPVEAPYDVVQVARLSSLQTEKEARPLVQQEQHYAQKQHVGQNLIDPVNSFTEARFAKMPSEPDNITPASPLTRGCGVVPSRSRTQPPVRALNAVPCGELQNSFLNGTESSPLGRPESTHTQFSALLASVPITGSCSRPSLTLRMPSSTRDRFTTPAGAIQRQKSALSTVGNWRKRRLGSYCTTSASANSAVHWVGRTSSQRGAAKRHLPKLTTLRQSNDIFEFNEPNIGFAIGVPMRKYANNKRMRTSQI
jgi:hypothetical protein